VAEQGAVVPWELTRLEKRGELEPDEAVSEAEEAWTRFGRSRGRVGALVLTDRRLIFVTTGVITRRTRLVSIPLGTIEAVEVVDSPRWGEDRGAIAVDTVDEEETRRVEFERIAGGGARAAEIADAIRRRQQAVPDASA
jgi:Bacterial PH domain